MSDLVALIKQIETSSRAKLTQVRAALANQSDRREAFLALFPGGLSFTAARTPGGERQIWRIRAPAESPMHNETLNGRSPVVLPSNPTNPGLDLAYARAHAADLRSTYPVGSPNGSESHFMPNMMPAFAVRDGVISYAGKLASTYAVILNHLNGWATYYANLEHMFAMPTNHRSSREVRVKAGDVLGFIGSPSPGALKCLHFQLWKSDKSLFVPIDPSDEMSSWLVLPLTDARLTPIEAVNAQAEAA